MKMSPVLYFTVLLLSVSHPGVSLDFEDVHSKSMFDIAFHYMQGRGHLLFLLEDFVPHNGEVALHDLATLLNDQGQDDSSCNTCKAVFTAVKAVTAIYDWHEVRDAVVEACHAIFNNSEEYVRHDVLCPGTVDSQGPHVFEIAKAKHRKSAEQICTFLNSCFLPKPDQRLFEQETPLHNRKSSTNRPKGVDLRSLKKRKETAIKVVQLADIHIEPDYAEGSSSDCGLYVCCDMKYGPGDAGAYGDYSCNIPQRTMELFLKKTAELQPEFILYSGDTPPHTLWEETYQSQVNCSTVLVDAMERHIQAYRVFPNIGNHEMYPTNLYSVEYLPSYTAPMNEEFTQMWSTMARFSTESEETMRLGGYYTELIKPGLRVLSFNTNYWYTFNWYNVLNDGQLEVQQMLTFMQQTLQLAKENEEKVIVMGHHPPGTADTILHYSRLFEELVSQYSDVIILHVAGHIHTDEFRVHSDSSGTPIATMFASPSVTTSTNKNPSMRVFYIDEATHELLDFEQYGFMLDQLKGVESGEPNITFIYSAVQEYGLEDMSAGSWRNFIDRLETDDDLFAAYLKHYSTGHPSDTCDAQCRWGHICTSQFYSYDDIVQCRNNAPQPTEVPSTTRQFNRGTSLHGNIYFVTFVHISGVMCILKKFT